MAGGPSQLDLFDHKPLLNETERPGPARARPHGPAAHRHDRQPGDAAAGRVDLQVRQARQERRDRQRTAAVDREDGRRAVLRQVVLHRGDQPRPGDHVLARPGTTSPAGRAWARGSATASAAPTRTCRRSSCSSRRTGIDQAAVRPAVGQRLPAERAPGRAVPLRRTPVLYLDNPAGRLARSAPQDASTGSPNCNARRPTTAATRRSPAASRSTRWPSACRRACPT